MCICPGMACWLDFELHALMICYSWWFVLCRGLEGYMLVSIGQVPLCCKNFTSCAIAGL